MSDLSPKLVMTPLGQYVAAQWDGVNRSGVTPIDDRVLILPDGAAETTTGGVEIPENVVARMTEAAETGVIVAIGPNAWEWNSDRTRRFTGEKPKVGDRVVFARYSGSFHPRPDGKRYRLMDDKCVGGLLNDDPVKVKGKPHLTRVTNPPLIA